MMAGHPNGVRLESLRNLPFMIWCGADDSDYDRNKVCAEYIGKLDALRKETLYTRNDLSYSFPCVVEVKL